MGFPISAATGRRAVIRKYSLEGSLVDTPSMKLDETAHKRLVSVVSSARRLPGPKSIRNKQERNCSHRKKERSFCPISNKPSSGKSGQYAPKFSFTPLPFPSAVKLPFSPFTLILFSVSRFPGGARGRRHSHLPSGELHQRVPRERALHQTAGCVRTHSTHTLVRDTLHHTQTHTHTQRVASENVQVHSNETNSSVPCCPSLRHAL